MKTSKARTIDAIVAVLIKQGVTAQSTNYIDNQCMEKPVASIGI